MPLAQQLRWGTGDWTMATATLEYREQSVAVGRVFDRAFSTIRHHPLAALAIAVFFTGLPGTAVDYFLSQLPWAFTVMTIGSFRLPGTFALTIATWFIALLFGVVAQGAMTRPAIAESEGRKAPLGEVFAAAVRVLVPLVILGAIFAVTVIIGTSLLIVPGVLIRLLWAVAPSAEAHERDGVFLALSRSQELSEGARWKVFGILLVLFAIVILFTVLIVFLEFLMVRMDWAVSNFFIVRLVLRGAMGAILNVIWGAVLASLYVELVQWKEGGSVEALERVFV
jgi:hypothetical protein